jgi:hypothetical protein
MSTVHLNLVGHNVAFDWENGRVGFAQSSCAYDTTNKTNENTDFSLENDGYARDCHLSSTAAVLSEKCMETVDVRLCLETDDPTNVALMGTETWTRLVETPGTSDGLSCLETAQRDYQRHSRSSTSSFTAGSGVQDGVTLIDSLLPSQFTCPGEGVCLEYRPCEVPCSQVLDYHKRTNKIPNEQAPPSSPDHTTPTGGASQSHSKIADEFAATSNGFCGDSYWSACDTSCLQSRIVSTWGRRDYNVESIGNNNACVEVSRQSRSCHIDACGRSDPCRVPFLVHAIFALKSGDAEKWSPRALDFFQRALFLAAHNLDPSQEQSNEERFLFQPGDVDVMLVRPWQIDPDDVEVEEKPDETATSSDSPQGTGAEESSGRDGIVGIELVVQISIFNAKAHTIPPSSRQPTEDDDAHGDSAPSRPPPLRRMTGIANSTSESDQRRYLLQEIGDMVRNMTIFQRARTAPESTCNESDLYRLAKDAVMLATSVFQQPDFVLILIDTVEELEAADAALTKDDSPFLPVYERARNIRASHLVSAWTVGTQIYDSGTSQGRIAYPSGWMQAIWSYPNPLFSSFRNKLFWADRGNALPSLLASVLRSVSSIPIIFHRVANLPNSDKLFFEIKKLSVNTRFLCCGVFSKSDPAVEWLWRFDSLETEIPRPHFHTNGKAIFFMGGSTVNGKTPLLLVPTRRRTR